MDDGQEAKMEILAGGDIMKKIAMFVFAAALCGPSGHAQQPAYVQPAGGGFPFEEPEQEVPAGMQKIFSNLGPAAHAYASSGWAMWGPFGNPYPEFLALPFKPKADAHVQQLRAAIQHISGANQVNLSLYSDNGGVPGKLLAGPVTVKRLPAYTACCKLAVANLAGSVSVTAGTQYWIVADTPAFGTGSDFNGAWAFVPSKLMYGSYRGTGWQAFPANQDPAGGVYGTIP